MKILILTNGGYGDYSFCKNADTYDYIICADAGMKHCRKLNLIPHLIVGDFDSTNMLDLMYYEDLNVPIHRFSTHKDETDTELALRYAIEEGATEVVIWGAVGSRLDHTLGNVHLLYSALKQGVKVTLMNEKNTVMLVDNMIELKGQIGQLVSLIPFSEKVEGISTIGLAYSLSEDTLWVGSSIGVSNYMTSSKAIIKVKAGFLLVILAND
ncbi:thiamine diphosphokinase [Cellulosilyticum ruminicola]|uniref:thiamine diphosphokinase n=1 Tax=Cellulosilyticum ruminicola TaxID=425254 RepID=UPI0006D208C9|nr:thiamine diphosphokinase [Cellulosilyticum ruminicola]